MNLSNQRKKETGILNKYQKGDIILIFKKKNSNNGEKEKNIPF